MQFFILLLGALVFVFYQFEKPPVFFNQADWQAHAQGAERRGSCARSKSSSRSFTTKRRRASEPGSMRNTPAIRRAKPRPATEMLAAAEAQRRACMPRPRTTPCATADPKAKTNGRRLCVHHVHPRLSAARLIGLLIAVIFAAALSSSSSELNALGSTTDDRFLPARAAQGARRTRTTSRASRWFTALWGVVAVGFALFANLVENLIQAVNIVGSIFYGVVLGMFLVAFFLQADRRHGGVLGRAGGADAGVRSRLFQRSTSAISGTTSSAARPACSSACLAGACAVRTTARAEPPPIMSTAPVICFGQQPCGFFPRRFLVAKIQTARRLQAEIGGEIVFFYHDSDHDPRETQTILRHRKTSEPAQSQLRVREQDSTKFSPLYLKRIPADWQARPVLQLPNYVDAPLDRAFQETSRARTSPTSAWRCIGAWACSTASAWCARAIRRSAARPAR